MNAHLRVRPRKHHRGADLISDVAQNRAVLHKKHFTP
jgi:hypothetical protein